MSGRRLVQPTAEEAEAIAAGMRAEEAVLLRFAAENRESLKHPPFTVASRGLVYEFEAFRPAPPRVRAEWKVGGYPEGYGETLAEALRDYAVSAEAHRMRRTLASMREIVRQKEEELAALEAGEGGKGEG